jgi:hypothetical protein
MDALRMVEERVHAYLGSLGLAPEQTEDGMVALKYGSTVVLLSVFQEGADTYVRFASILLQDFDPSMELLQRLLRLNTEVLFGSFLLFEDSTLSFSATLLGNSLEYDAFEKTLSYVASVSDAYDDELQALGGGQRAIDVMGTE